MCGGAVGVVLPGEGGDAGMQGGEEAGVQAEGAGVQQCGEGAGLAGASWKGTLNGCSVQYRKNNFFANRARHFIY